MKFTRVEILLTNGPDKLRFATDLPDSLWPFTGNAVMGLEVAFGLGEEYVKKHFPLLPFRVINTRSAPIPWG